jgi:hypothetical protein
VPNVVEIRAGWKLCIVAGGVMVRILLNIVAGGVKVRILLNIVVGGVVVRILLNILAGGVMTITPPATIHSFHPTQISTTFGTYLSRIMIDSLMMAL